MVGAFYATAEEKRRAWCEGGGGQVKSLQPESGLQQLPAVPVPGPQDAAQRSRTRQDAQRMPAWRTPPLPFPCRAHAHREAEQLAAARAQAAAAHAARDAQWAAQPQRVVVDTQRPWNAASTTYYMPAEVEAEARRRQQREAAEANRAAVQYRAAAEARARAAEQTALHAAMAAEVSAGRGGGVQQPHLHTMHGLRKQTSRLGSTGRTHGVYQSYPALPSGRCCNSRRNFAANTAPSSPLTDAQDTYFNLGAASERWIPPERRVKQRAAVPAQVGHAAAFASGKSRGSGCAKASRCREGGRRRRHPGCHDHGQGSALCPSLVDNTASQPVMPSQTGPSLLWPAVCTRAPSLLLRHRTGAEQQPTGQRLQRAQRRRQRRLVRCTRAKRCHATPCQRQPTRARGPGSGSSPAM